MARKPFSKEVKAQVAYASRRRCALCFGVEGVTTAKRGQVAHIDDPADARLANAAWLCRRHHDQYDSRSRQTTGYMVQELRRHQADLFEYLAGPMPWPDAGISKGRLRSSGVSLRVFEQRLPTYRRTKEFLRYVNQIDGLKLQDLLQFAWDTDEAIFLFDDELAAYLSDLFKKAMHLRAIGLTLEVPERHTPELINEQMMLSLWFTEQFEETRKRFAPFLRIAHVD